MGKIYAQVVNSVVNLIGGAEVGLPVIDDVAISLDITDLSEEDRPEIGWFYIPLEDGDGYFSTTQPPLPPPEPKPPTLDEKVDALGVILVQLILK